MPSTQRHLAELLGVDITTMQGWESGRRPLSAISVAQFQTIRRRLLKCGADPELVVLLEAAGQADAVITHALENPVPSRQSVEHHPLAQWVYTRTAAHMIAWALTGAPPAALPQNPPETPRRRGPTPDSPLLPAAERQAAFSHLRRCAEEAERLGQDGALLRRQAVYLCSYDSAPDTHAWVGHMRKPMRFTFTSPLEWSDARSIATSLTRHGEQDVLWAFIDHGMRDDAGEAANLNYWAYWLGLDPLPRADDGFMASRSSRQWDASALLRAMASRLDPGLACIDLNVHSVWALLAAHPALLTVDARLTADLAGRVLRLLDSDSASSRARRELEQLNYGLRMTRA
ncbi:helix-turn-helix domain-containing protein [Streptomyces millisiae]|uniref:Helix-turn-helix transcriptional regulator n=1 Tax=Streptomyces millisiae TaxID=3075542 RepID=A0ABU2M0H4_9ACTN|nr:helix-turn-helix transcriptional regulator [Streptomyces sp. DSM 44918]MDT0323350.1 helix-turn-helix transcriptional regulator [Streptomyces sp. DSM 44918]